MANLDTKSLIPVYILDWEQYFKLLKIDKPKFVVRLCYKSKELNEETISFFESEVKSENNIYIELVDWNCNSYHSDKRVLYKLEPNPNWKEDYVSVRTNSYLVPLTKLTTCSEKIFKTFDLDNDRINSVQDELPELEEIKIEQEFEDPLVSLMTIRDYITIHCGIPVSTKSWLNDLIIKNGRKEINSPHSNCTCRNNKS